MSGGTTECVQDDGAVEMSPVADESVGRTRYVIISGYHDYRSKRKANLHFIADELKLRGDTFFFSLRYSYLTRYKQDPRHDLWKRANTFETVDGVSCYLWRTLLHPFRLPKWLRLIEKSAFVLFALRFPRTVQQAIDKADTIFVESGIAITYVPLIKRRNPRAKIIYMASDSLGAIGQAHTIKECFGKYAHLYDSARVPSPYLRVDVPSTIPCYYIPHGIDKKRFEAIGSSPFAAGTINAVSVGSMLFDASFFQLAGPMFPHITFHVIGSGHARSNDSNIMYYPEMPFDSTLPFLKHANFAIAPYRPELESYLTHTSMKMMQYSFLGITTVCPQKVVGYGLGRIGYEPGSVDSIVNGIRNALAAPAPPAQAHLGWDQVTNQLLKPHLRSALPSITSKMA